MKRKLALLTLILLALAIALTACTQTKATEIKVRWDTDGEEHVFAITLADFSSSGGFNSYTHDNATYYKDISIYNEVLANDSDKLDEVCPQLVTGTYTLSIKPSRDGTSFCEVSATQVLYAMYQDSDLGNISSELQKLVVTGDGNPLGDKAGCTTLKSTTETWVKFENQPSQQPIESSTKVNGFYIGKTFQGASQYEISTKYNFDGKRPVATVTLNDGEAVEYDLPKNSTVNIIDSNQVLIYLRSLDKSSTSFQDNPSVYVFDPYTHVGQTANFSLVREQNLRLTDMSRASDDNTLYTKLSVVGVTVGGNAFMVAENLPERINAQGLDQLVNGNAKYTTVRFRVGYLAFELASYDDAIWNGLNAKTSE